MSKSLFPGQFSRAKQAQSTVISQQNTPWVFNAFRHRLLNYFLIHLTSENLALYTKDLNSQQTKVIYFKIECSLIQVLLNLKEC